MTSGLPDHGTLPDVPKWARRNVQRDSADFVFSPLVPLLLLSSLD
jgi:hypothetical protein